jgi:hypothetical protein
LSVFVRRRVWMVGDNRGRESTRARKLVRQRSIFAPNTGF